MSKSKIDFNSVVRASADHLDAQLDDATVLLHLGSGEYFSLGGVASRIWALLQEPLTVSSLIDQLLVQYDVDPARCRTETLAMLERLEAEGLLTVDCA